MDESSKLNDKLLSDGSSDDSSDNEKFDSSDSEVDDSSDYETDDSSDNEVDDSSDNEFDDSEELETAGPLVTAVPSAYISTNLELDNDADKESVKIGGLVTWILEAKN